MICFFELRLMLFLKIDIYNFDLFSSFFVRQIVPNFLRVEVKFVALYVL